MRPPKSPAATKRALLSRQSSGTDRATRVTPHKDEIRMTPECDGHAEHESSMQPKHSRNKTDKHKDTKTQRDRQNKRLRAGQREITQTSNQSAGERIGSSGSSGSPAGQAQGRCRVVGHVGPSPSSKSTSLLLEEIRCSQTQTRKQQKQQQHRLQDAHRSTASFINHPHP